MGQQKQKVQKCTYDLHILSNGKLYKRTYATKCTYILFQYNQCYGGIKMRLNGGMPGYLANMVVQSSL